MSEVNVRAAVPLSSHDSAGSPKSAIFNPKHDHIIIHQLDPSATLLVPSRLNLPCLQRVLLHRATLLRYRY